MLIFNQIIDYIKSNKIDYDFIAPTNVFGATFYGDLIDSMIKCSDLSFTYVACEMGIDVRKLSYIKSRFDTKHHHISFYDSLKFVIVLNLSLVESISFLRNCNYCLCPAYERDQIIYQILSFPHSDTEGMIYRLDCINALEVNEPFNDNNYDYLTLFQYLKRKR